MAYSLLNRMPLIKAQADTAAVNYKSLEIEQVEVIGRRSQAVFTDVSRMVTIVSRDDIEKAGVQNILDLLEFISTIDIRQRGNFGIQADASIRGGSFDHVMILVNGINLSDPQTGHLSLDLPIDHEAIERVEILEGPAARVLGPGAFTGALNIITRRMDRNSIAASQVFGDFGYRRTQFNGMMKTGMLHSSISASHSASEGFAPNTDHKLQNLFYRGTISKNETLLDLQSGYQHKKFGAGGFYSPRFPNQFEEADVWFASLKITTGNVIKVSPVVYWRRRKDHFLLERENPAFYENFHLTDVYGSQLNISAHHKHATSTLGFDLRSENILSNNIGFDSPEPIAVRGTDSAFYTKRYSRTNFAVFGESHWVAGKLKITGGLMVNWNTAYPNKPAVFPGVDMSYRMLPGSHLFFSFNRALHLPTFTDLFYKDPVNQGNIKLSPNRMIAFEGGLKYNKDRFTGNLTFFCHLGKDIIDWLWTFSHNRYTPVNLDNYRAIGMTSGLTVNFAGNSATGKWLSSVSVNYLYLSINKSIPDSVSKYYNLQHKLGISVRHKLSQKITLSWNISYQDRFGEVVIYQATDGKYSTHPYKPFWLIDGTIRWNSRYIWVFTEISNMLDTRYIDAGSAIQPGRWLKAGLAVNL